MTLPALTARVERADPSETREPDYVAERRLPDCDIETQEEADFARGEYREEP